MSCACAVHRRSRVLYMYSFTRLYYIIPIYKTSGRPFKYRGSYPSGRRREGNQTLRMWSYLESTEGGGGGHSSPLHYMGVVDARRRLLIPGNTRSSRYCTSPSRPISDFRFRQALKFGLCPPYTH